MEIHPDYVKGENSLRAVENGIGRGDVLVHRLYGCINIDGQLYRVKTTMYEYRRTSEQKKNTPHSYEVTKIELLEAPWWNDHQHAAMTSNNSISGAKLLQNVEQSYEKGKKVIDESRKMVFNCIRCIMEVVQTLMRLISGTWVRAKGLKPSAGAVM